MKRKGDIAIRVPSIKELERPSEYSKPTELAYFSYNESRELLIASRQSLGIFKQPVLPLDLNVGYPDRFIKDEDPGGIKSLLRSIKNLNVKPFVCTWRGIMTKIICTPYSQRDEWELMATLHNGTIYLQEVEKFAKRANRYGNSKEQELFTYYGYNFETLCTEPFDHNHLATADTLQDRDSKNKPDDAVEEKVTNTNIQFCTIFTSKIGGYRLLLGGEVDCLHKHPKNEDSDSYQKEYLELKTHKLITNDREDRSFRCYKLLKTWAQCYLAGIPKVIFGFRDKSGMVREIRQYETSEFPRMARKDRLWDPNVCLNFGKTMMKILKDNITIDDPKCSYVVRYSEGSLYIEEPSFDSDMLNTD